MPRAREPAINHNNAEKSSSSSPLAHTPRKVTSQAHVEDDSHLKQEALRLAQRRRLALLQPVERNDASDAGPDVGHAGEDDEGVLDIAHSPHAGVGDEDAQDAEEADGAAHALERGERVDLLRSELFGGGQRRGCGLGCHYAGFCAETSLAARLFNTFRRELGQNATFSSETVVFLRYGVGLAKRTGRQGVDGASFTRRERSNVE